MIVEQEFSWWASLRHGGCLIAPARIGEFFAAKPEHLSEFEADALRRELVRFHTQHDLPQLLDAVLEQVLGLPASQWAKANAVDKSWTVRTATGEAVRPRRIWREPNGGILPVFTSEETRIGIGRSRRDVARVTEWLRKTSDVKIALITNGSQWRLIHAGQDYDAWCEWDISLWFEEGQPGGQVQALRSLIGRDSLSGQALGQPSRLVEAIQASRRGQAELSSALGERVRRAVELLITESRPVIERLEAETNPVSRRDIYLAAVRLVMRCVVILFAEARDLLPRNHPIYHNSYGIQGLQEQLEQNSRDLGQRYSTWPRLLALFRLIFHGSQHQGLTILRYAGGLFHPGDSLSSDPVLRALAAFEYRENNVTDKAVYQLLSLLTKILAGIRVGRSVKTVSIPVDFSQLDTEYIGILYEGLLDYELRRADRVPLLFLNLGDQPVLPLDDLETMDEAALENLLKKAASQDKGSEEEEEAEDESAESETPEPVAEVVAEEAPELATSAGDDVQQVKSRVHTWAKKAAIAGKLVRKPRGKAQDIQQQFEDALNAAASKLVSRTVQIGDYFLVRWGGTRKGSGTFYTKPALAAPTVRRTLEPLCLSDEGTLRPPNEIIALKVADIASGSGSFLVAALRFLSRTLYESLFAHGWLTQADDGSIDATLPSEARPPWFVEAIYDLPLTSDNPESRIQARLRRLIVERCLYGVDLDPLAVELCRLSLWVETMDQKLPFSFLDHKIKVGNALVGCWLDRFQHYPWAAWEREGGDKNHKNFVHHFRDIVVKKGKKAGLKERINDPWTAEIKRLKDEVIKVELKHLLEARQSQQVLDFMKPAEVNALHERGIRIFEALHNDIRDPDRQAEVYEHSFTQDLDLQKLRAAFDLWCALWFWPADELTLAPTPKSFHQPSAAVLDRVRELKKTYHFFHWELEFPDVFTPERPGFDAIIGNPPWEIQKPNSREFFSNIDPLYRTYGKQVAIEKQRYYFQMPEKERDWLAYNARLKAMGNWTKSAGEPFYPETRDAPSPAADEAIRFTSPEHPFLHQGGADVNTYKLFLEQAHHLARPHGWFGLIVPSGLYTDKGCQDLRSLFIDKCRWRWLFSFENRDGIFEIHRSFKFCSVIVQKSGSTQAIRAAFMQRDLSRWAEGEKYVLEYPKERIDQFSPKSRAILEISSSRDLEILETMYSNGVLLGDTTENGWGIEYRCEFHMTDDSKLFPPRPLWEAKGYQPDEYGHWIKGDWQNCAESDTRPREGWIRSRDGRQEIAIAGVEDVALPLMQGAMIWQYDFSWSGIPDGAGLNAAWESQEWPKKEIRPRFIMGIKEFLKFGLAEETDFRIGFRDLTNSTNLRTLIVSPIPVFPCGNKLPVLYLSAGVDLRLLLSASLNSFVVDFSLRLRFSTSAGAGSLNPFILKQLVLFQVPVNELIKKMRRILTGLCLSHKAFSTCWIQEPSKMWRECWAVSEQERLRRKIISDVAVAYLYRLRKEQFASILQDCDHPIESATSNLFTRILNPKGFWRVDKEKPPELRHTVLAQVAFAELERMGLDAFLNQNDGEGWMLPETLRLADYGLGHDERAQHPQPVAAALGPRFLDWQLNEDVEASWEECRIHAENIRALRAKFAPAAAIRQEQPSSPADLLGHPLELDLFGQES